MKSTLLALALLIASLPVLAQNQDATLVNGTNGYLDVPASPSLIPATGITLEAWVYFNNVGLNPTNLYPTIARKNVAPGAEEYFFRVQGTGVLRWKIKISATLSLTVDSPAPMPGNVWTHVAGTYDGTIARLYMNGVQVATAAGAGAPFNGGGGLRIGKGDDQAGLPSEVWSGKLDEVRLWSVARTASQIQATMNFQLPAVPNLVSSWRMSGNGLDSIGTNHGTVQGTVTFGPSTLALNTGGAPWQTNHPELSLDIDGVSSDGFGPAVVTKTFTACAPATATGTISTILGGYPWDIAITSGPGVPAGGGGIITAGGQIANINVADPTLTFLFSPGSGPPVTTLYLPVTFTGPFAASAQAVIFNPLSPDGFSLSSLVELHVVAGASSIPGPTLDDSVVTVALPHPALCGSPSVIPFYGTSYSTLDVSSNGRVMFGWPTPNTAFTPSVAAAQTGYPFVGPWCDLAPNLGGNITISTPAFNVLRVNWNAVRFFANTATVTFGIQFDASLGSVQIDGLAGIPAVAVNQFLGITAGLLGPATDPGATAFVSGGPFFTANAFDMIYGFGTAGSLTPGLSVITFVPSISGGYDWSAF